MKKQKCLSSLNIGNETYSIRATVHSMERMEQRKIDEYMVTGAIMSLGKERIIELQKDQDDFIIVDEENEVSIVISFKKNTMMILTVIDKSKVFAKKNTKIIKL